MSNNEVHNDSEDTLCSAPRLGQAQLANPGGVLVLGMHRSGTSAVAGLLNKAGYFVGDDDDLMTPGYDNPTGYFERADVMSLNDSFLDELSATWDNPPDPQAVKSRAPWWRPRVASLVWHVRAGAGDRPFVIKDPRVSLLLPAWLPVLADAFVPVVTIRHPLAVAESLHARNGTPLLSAVCLWQIYYTQILESLSGVKVLVAHYDDLVGNPANEGMALLEALAVGPFANCADILDRSAQPAQFVSDAQRHHFVPLDSAEVHSSLSEQQAELWKWLRGLPRGWSELAMPREFREISANIWESVRSSAELVDLRLARVQLEREAKNRALEAEEACTQLARVEAERLQLEHWALDTAREAEENRNQLARVEEARLQLEHWALDTAREAEESRTKLALTEEAKVELERAAEDAWSQLTRVAHELDQSTALLRREETTVLRPVARRLVRLARAHARRLPPVWQDRVRAALLPVAWFWRPSSAEAHAYQQAKDRLKRRRKPTEVCSEQQNTCRTGREHPLARRPQEDGV